MRIINIPRTQTILAVGILAGCFVTKIEWRDALLMVLTFYFTKHDPGKITIHQPHSKSDVKASSDTNLGGGSDAGRA